MGLSNRDLVGKGFELLAEGLEPFVERHLTAVVPGGMDWLEWLSRRGPNRGMTQSKSDPLVLLRAVSQQDEIFKNTLSRAERSYAQELWECRNNWAHNSLFNDADTRRLLDTIERLLRATGAITEADEVQRLLRDHMRPAAQSPSQSASHKSYGQDRLDRIESRPDWVSPRPGASGGAVPLSRGPAAITSLGIGTFVVLAIVGLVVLPSASSTEKALIIGACAALSTAGVTGVGALRSTRRFAVAATAGTVTVVCLGCLSITASRTDYDQLHTTGNALSPSASTGHGLAASASPGRSSALASPVPTESASKRPTPKAVPLYLAGLVGTTDQAGIQSVAPEPGQWRMAGILYPHSLGYSGTSALCALQQSVTYQIPSSYQFFIATVGVFDIPSDPQGQGDAVEFQVDNGSGSQLGAQTAQYGEPAAIDVPVQGVTSLTLITSSTVGCFGDNSTEAVWGNARLVPGS